ncbi:hypothetical protein D9611_007448 [Ephemerocybe angulata]|uniref:Uncharacterized protein n=1 Tax=Ephemerocybe angulata TaxID=980116 RepID=A0A8H5CFH1_9AGAR|nr:hypothetical protein D9611_007448 [Tulosesus angulatus]
MHLHLLTLLTTLLLTTLTVTLARPIIPLETSLGVEARGTAAPRLLTFKRASESYYDNAIPSKRDVGPGEFGSGVRRPFDRSPRLTEAMLEGKVKEGGGKGKKGRILGFFRGVKRARD